MSKRHGIRLFLFLLTATALFITCRRYAPVTSMSRQNISNYYLPEEKMLRPRYVLYNVTDSLTRLYFTIRSTDLLYAKANGEANYSAHILLSYTVHPVDFPKIIADSGHVVLNDAAEPGEEKQLASSIDLDVYDQGHFVVDVAIRDLNKMTISYALLHLDHRSGNARNNFLVTMEGTETPVFRSYLHAGEKVNVHYHNSSVTRLHVGFYRNDYGPAPPPYAIEKKSAAPRPDSTWWLDLTGNPSLSFPQEGIYRFSTDTSFKDGLTISRFHEGFPEITEQKQLLYPLRYLTMRQEYFEMDTAVNTKKAVDKFWLNAAGSQERARELIRNFYNRVATVNTLFSSEKEGWKTDRGMLYLLLGPPQNVYRNSYGETWIYNSDQVNGLTFVFDYIPHAFSDEEYVLQRNVNYKINWIQAVDAWRQGHVYTQH